MSAVTRTVTPFKQGVPTGMQRSEQVVMRQFKAVGRSEAEALQQHAGHPVVCSGEPSESGFAPGLNSCGISQRWPEAEALQQHAECAGVCSGELSKTGSVPSLRAVAFQAREEALQQHAGRRCSAQVSCC